MSQGSHTNWLWKAVFDANILICSVVLDITHLHLVSNIIHLPPPISPSHLPHFPYPSNAISFQSIKCQPPNRLLQFRIRHISNSIPPRSAITMPRAARAFSVPACRFPPRMRRAAQAISIMPTRPLPPGAAVIPMPDPNLCSISAGAT